MYCIRKITDDITWVGANDRRLAMFEGVYAVPRGMSYNAYLLKDEKTVLFDTVDKAVRQTFMENVTEVLGGRKLDYLVIQHVEPDHTAAIRDIITRYPEVRIVGNEKTMAYLQQFFDVDIDRHAYIVKENEMLVTGKHTLYFMMAPMVHWPEVMVTYDETDRIIFSADAFGCFGALNGALFADEVDFAKDYMDEARRYYSNIVGKYGSQVQRLLEKVSALSVEIICPLHGFIWRANLNDFISKYALWSANEPEAFGVMIAYASIYGNTENAAEILACRLRDKGVPTAMFDVSVTPVPDIIAAAFKWSHLAFASTTYNAGVFVTMETLINELVAHHIENRTVAVIENGTWAASAGNLIRKKLGECKNFKILENSLTIKSSLKSAQLTEIDAMAEAIASSGPTAQMGSDHPAVSDNIERGTFFKLSYGLFILTARDGDKDNGCLINTAAQITEKPPRISVAVNKANLTHDMILKTGVFNVSILTENTPFAVFERFGYHSGRDTDKFAGYPGETRALNGVRYVSEHVNGVIAAKVSASFDYGTHTLFIADVTQAFPLSGEPSATYQFYFDHIKPKPPAPKEHKKGYICKICGYIHEGDSLPDDFICPLCKHGADDFEPLP